MFALVGRDAYRAEWDRKTTAAGNCLTVIGTKTPAFLQKSTVACLTADRVKLFAAAARGNENGVRRDIRWSHIRRGSRHASPRYGVSRETSSYRGRLLIWF